MLKLACDANVPLIALTTRDVLNFVSVVQVVTGKEPVKFDPASGNLPDKKGVYWMLGSKKAEYPYNDIYQRMLSKGSSMLVVNPFQVVEPMFFAGELTVPQKQVVAFLQNIVADKSKAVELAQVLGGCTIKEIAELARLTMARDASLTAKGLMLTRKTTFTPGKGLAPIDTNQPFYAPQEALVDWVKREKSFFLGSVDPRLVPRGLLFDGPPGTGKTAGAKWVASQLGVPLYRVDVAGTKGKYVGESETALATNLGRVDAEEPCVVLLDEVEKIFGQDHHDGGTTASMLSQMLWWLAEHQSRVLTIMTTNNAKSLPKELYREGRIDETMVLDGIAGKDIEAFVMNLLMTFEPMRKGWNGKDFSSASAAIIKAVGGSDKKVPQAKVTELVYRYLKTASKTLLTPA